MPIALSPRWCAAKNRQRDTCELDSNEELMPGTVYRGRSAEPAGIWKEGKLLDGDGVGTVLTKRGAEYFPGKSATPAYRVRGGMVFRGASSEPFCRVQGETVYKGNSMETLYRVRGDALTGPSSTDPIVRGTGLTTEELLMTALHAVGGGLAHS